MNRTGAKPKVMLAMSELFTLLPAEWTTQSGELTPSMKRRRRVIIDRYAKEIEELYA